MREIVPHILAAEADGVLTLTINRADKKNALTRQMYEGLAGALEAASDDETVGAVVLRGSGGVFTAGNDLKDFQARAQNGAQEGPQTGTADRRQASGGMLLLHALAGCRAPLVAEVSGLAIGIGTTLLLHCDFVYAGESARFRTPFVDIGLSVEGGSSLLLPQTIGPRAAARMLLAGEELDAREARELGLVTAVLPDAALEAEVRARAAALAAKPRTALRSAKRMLLEARGGSVLDTIEREFVAFSACLQSPEAKAFFARFFEKA